MLTLASDLILRMKLDDLEPEELDILRRYVQYFGGAETQAPTSTAPDAGHPLSRHSRFVSLDARNEVSKACSNK